MRYTPKAELLVDLNRPVEEIQEAILLITRSHPGKELEIMKEVELWLGDTISGIEKRMEEAQKKADDRKDDEIKKT